MKLNSFLNLFLENIVDSKCSDKVIKLIKDV